MNILNLVIEPMKHDEEVRSSEKIKDYKNLKREIGQGDNLYLFLSSNFMIT